jgi:preprotein translocase subunit SecA
MPVSKPMQKLRSWAQSRPSPTGPSSTLRQLVLCIRELDLSTASDVQLRDALQRLIRLDGPPAGSDAMLETFAIVDEAVGRRLGAWRLFDPSFDKGSLGRYVELADRIADAAPYRDRVEFYSDPKFLDGQGFERALEPMLREAGLGSDERTIVRTIIYVAERRQTGLDSNILLPAGFYGALEAMDRDGLLRFRVSDEQLTLGLSLADPIVVEMNAGEGKTVAAAFAGVAQVVSGRSVHVMTANEYLAARDADWLGPVYESLGLTVGVVLGHMEDEERRHQYGQHIVYGTLREFGFDFMRDNLRLPPDERVQKHLDVAIVDEADHALVDQAGTPLVISGNPAGSRRAFERTWRAVQGLVSEQVSLVAELEAELPMTALGSTRHNELLAMLLMASPDSDALASELGRGPELYRQVSALAERDADDGKGGLASGLMYVVDPHEQSVVPTEKGQSLLERTLGPIFDSAPLERKLALAQANCYAPLEDRRTSADRLRRRLFRQSNRMSQVHEMLRASVLLKRYVDYVVSDGAIVLIDEPTGRTLPDNRYRWGLHAALEANEGVPVHDESETLAQVSVREFMGLYSHVAGMTGTAAEARDELKREYGLEVACVDPGTRSARVDYPSRLYRTRQDKLAAIADEVAFCRSVGRPILVGTLTVEQSEELSELLRTRGIDHNLLNAVNNAKEAEIIRRAGRFGAVTIATNMAGRGTDIVLDADVDRRVAARFMEHMSGLLSGGPEWVEVVCGSAAEAALLREAVEVSGDAPLLRVDAGDGPTGRVLRVSPVSTSGDRPACDRPVRLEFGLGLYVIGAERNQTFRVDRQLRGRSGRQGAFGASRFILSLEDRFLRFREDNASCMSDGPSVDAAGRISYSGPRLERQLYRIQDRLELDAEAGRSLRHQYGRVLEEQTMAFYRVREEVLEADSLYDACRGFAAGSAERLVARHFPQGLPGEYAPRFDAMAEELWLDFGVDCENLFGASMEGLAPEIAALVVQRIEHARSSLGDAGFVKLEKLLFLRTADEMWRGHVAVMEESVLNIALGYLDVKHAVAELRMRGAEAYETFKTTLVDSFVPRLLGFPLESADDEDEAEGETTLSEDVLAILV